MNAKKTPTRKRCRDCRELRLVSDFPDGKLLCKMCRQVRSRMVTSQGPTPFLRRLFQQAKYSQTNRKTNKGHPNKADFNILVEDLFGLWEKQEGRCALSGIALTYHRDGSGRKDFNASIDRIVPHQPYQKNNIQLVAYRVNIMKHELTEDLFYWWIKTLHDNMKDKSDDADDLP